MGAEVLQVINRNRQFRWKICRLFSMVKLSIHKSRKSMKEKNWELLVLNEQVGQIGVAPMVTVSLVKVQKDSLINKSEMVNEVQLWLNMLKYENKM